MHWPAEFRLGLVSDAAGPPPVMCIVSGVKHGHEASPNNVLLSGWDSSGYPWVLHYPIDGEVAARPPRRGHTRGNPRLR